MQKRKEGVLTMYVQAMRKKRSIKRNKWKMSKPKKKGLKIEWNKQKVYKGDTHRIIIKYDQFGSLWLGY
jgi:hypothetical protein